MNEMTAREAALLQQIAELSFTNASLVVEISQMQQQAEATKPESEPADD